MQFAKRASNYLSVSLVSNRCDLWPRLWKSIPFETYEVGSRLPLDHAVCVGGHLSDLGQNATAGADIYILN